MRKALIATDLDRTMIYSSASAGRALGDAVCVEYYDDAPLSYMTPEAAQSLSALAAVAVVVPTTTRTVEQYRRIAVPGAPHRYAITSNGGNVLVDGVADPSWRAAVDSAVSESAVPLEVVVEEQSTRGGDWVLGQRAADDLFCYMIVETAVQPPEFLAQWSAWCHENGWGASQQGRKIYAIPTSLSKSVAVAEVRARLIAEGLLDPEPLTLAAGDGALDADMLAAADRAIRPRHGELEALNWTHPTVSVTALSGIDAGAEIVDWFTEHVA